MNDFIEAIDFPTVIQAAGINSLRSGKEPEKCSAFMRGYLGFDEHARFTLETLINSLAQPGPGGAFFINGVFGSGKSHLLGLLTLLGEGRGHADFLAVHSHFTSQLGTFPKRFVVYFSLDEYDGARFSLEEITRREILLQAKNQGIELQAFNTPQHVSRSEQFAVLEEELTAHGYVGLQLCVDELSLFLGAKDHRSLQGEASWLQFLGQRAARAGAFSVWCCFALQKEWEDVGDLEPYSLSQVRDRYQSLTLSMAHLPSLVQHRLVRQKDPEAIGRLCRQSFQELSRAWPQTDLGIAEWEALYPFHPTAINLLEQVATRFFSRTRSAVQFCAGALKRYLRDEADSSQRIIAAEVFDYFKPEFAQFAELKALDGVWRAWEEMLPRIARDKEENILLAKLLKSLLLFRLSGQAVSAIHLAHTLGEDLGLGGEGNYRYIHQLLSRWCKEGDHLSLERGDDWQSDRFSVALGQSIQQTVRRYTQSALETLQHDDARIISHLLEACGNVDFPLKSLLSAPLQMTVDWQHSSRRVEVALWQRHTSAQLVNQLAAWGQPGGAEVFLFLRMPLQETALPHLNDADERAKAALLVWEPRRPTSDEWEFARETTARALLLHDPALRDNRRGRAVIKFLERDLNERLRDIQHFMIRLYCEGRLTCGDHRAIEVGELCHQREWNTLVETIASFSLEALYTKFIQVAPAVKILSPAQVNQLGAKLLGQSEADCWWPPSLDRPVRAIAAPLGLAGEDKGRWEYAVSKEELNAEIESLLGENALAVSVIETHLASSQWGLMPLQCSLVICALLGAGHIEALDANGKMLPLHRVKMPLRQNVYAVRRAVLMVATAWGNVCNIVKIVCGQSALPLSFESQMRAAEKLREWHQNAEVEIELANVRLQQLQKMTDSAPALWQRTTQVMRDMALLSQALSSPESGVLLEHAAALDAQCTKATLQQWQRLQQELDSTQHLLLQALSRLTHPQMVAPPELAGLREGLLKQFLEGEDVLFNEHLLHEISKWDATFQEQYRHWHQQQYTGGNWGEARAFAHQAALQALEKLAVVERYPFPRDTELRAALQAALNRQCPRDGSLLPHEVSCNQCQLRYGQLVELPDLTEFSGAIKEALGRLEVLLQNAETKNYLQRSSEGRALLSWNGKGEELLPLLDEAALGTLKKALAPRRHYQRSAQRLQQQLGGGGTREELESAFKRWMEEGNVVAPDDEIIISEGVVA